MSVVVIGMEMPRACIDGHYLGNCPMDRILCAQRFAPEGRSQKDIFRDRNDKLPDWCPLRPLPDAHGDLIDRGQLVGRFAPRQAYFTDAIKEKIETAPTILEAEGESDE